MGKELTKAPLSFSMDLDSPHIRADTAADILGLSGCAHNVVCRPVFSAIPAPVVFCVPPGSRGNWGRAFSRQAVFVGFCFLLGRQLGKLSFSPPALNKAGVTALSREQSRLTHVCLPAGLEELRRRVW